MEDFLLTFPLYAKDGTLFIGTTLSRQVGDRQLCSIQLRDGKTLVRGMAEVVSVSGPGSAHPGLRLKMVELDRASHVVHRELIRRARLLDADKTGPVADPTPPP